MKALLLMILKTCYIKKDTQMITRYSIQTMSHTIVNTLSYCGVVSRSINFTYWDKIRTPCLSFSEKLPTKKNSLNTVMYERIFEYFILPIFNKYCSL